MRLRAAYHKPYSSVTFGKDSLDLDQNTLNINDSLSTKQSDLIMGLGSNHVLVSTEDSSSVVTKVDESLPIDRPFSSSSDTSDSSHVVPSIAKQITAPVLRFRNKTTVMSREERAAKGKSTSDISFKSSKKALSSVLDSKRPNSQFYADLDDELFVASPTDTSNMPNLLRLTTVSSGSQPILTGMDQHCSNPDGTSGLLSGYLSLRTSTPLLSPVDSLLRKFRKSFAFRFHKKKLEQRSDYQSCAASINEVEPIVKYDNTNNHITDCNVPKPEEPVSSTSKSSKHENDNLLQNIPISQLVLRPSSRERKKCKRKKDGRLSLFCDSFDNVYEETIVSSDACKKNGNVSSGSDANVLRKRAASTSDYSPKSKAPQRPLSVIDYLALDNSSCTKTPEHRNNFLRTTSEIGHVDDQPQKNCSTLDNIWRSNPVKLCRVHSRLMMCRHKGRYRLRRSMSHPVELEMAGSINVLGDTTRCSTDQESSQKGSLSSDDDVSSDSDLYHNYCCSPNRRSTTCWELTSEGTMYAEALWDHETLDTEELPFRTGDVIEVTDTSDKEWWWGSRAGQSGWFPASFVRLYMCHRGASASFNDQTTDIEPVAFSPCKSIMSNLTCEQVRANIITEIVYTEREYVKHLKDMVEGYLGQVRRRPDMFVKEHVETVFGNIEEIYAFQNKFLVQLEEYYDTEQPHLSQIGDCFLNHKEEFKMYSQYCNNHPLAVSELQELFSIPRYAQFFEACRLLQDMIDISLDGFLLTPIQRICKYPLQLSELLKYTDSHHPDHIPVSRALAAMKEVAELVNERKRRMECLERIAEWQNTIEGWVGPDVLEVSSILMHCGEVTRVSSSWSRDVYLFIFDHQLVYCKKDLLKRNSYAYKGRLNLDCCDIVNIEDGRDSQFGVNVKNAWKIYFKEKDKWFLFYAKTAPEKDQWLKAFTAERKRVDEDKEQGFVVTEDAKKSAKMAVQNKQKPKRPRAKISKGRRCHPDAAVTELLLLDLPSAKARSGSLPSNIHPELAIMTGAKLTPSRKKGSGWFHFGSGKKPKT